MASIFDAIVSALNPASKQQDLITRISNPIAKATYPAAEKYANNMAQNPINISDIINRTREAMPAGIIPGQIEEGPKNFSQKMISAYLANPSIAKIVAKVSGGDSELIQQRAMQDLITSNIKKQLPNISYQDLPKDIKGVVNKEVFEPVVKKETPQPTGEAKIEVPELPQRESMLYEFLKQMGIPLATAGIGMLSKSALPGAAGFQQGYVGERQRQQLAEESSMAQQAETEKELANRVAVEQAKSILKKNELSISDIVKLLELRKKSKGNVLGLGKDKETLNYIDSLLKQEGNESARIPVKKGDKVMTVPASQLEAAREQGWEIATE